MTDQTASTFILATIDHHKEVGPRWTEAEITTESFEELFLKASLFARVHGSEWCGVFASGSNTYICDVNLRSVHGLDGRVGPQSP